MTYASEVAADSPLVYYRLGESSGTTITDSSGNARDGVWGSTPTQAVTGLLAGDSNTACNFNGSANFGSYTDPGGSTWLDVTTTFTLEAWIKPDQVTALANVVARDNGGTAGGARRYFILRTTTSGKAEFVFWLSASTGTARFVTGATTLVVGNTYHLVATYDGSVGRLYVNGVEDASLTVAGALPVSNTASPFVISRRADASSDFFDGVLDEIAMYGTALSPTRVGVHYSAGTASPNATVSAVAATATASAPAPTVSATRNATVVGVVAAATALALAPVVSTSVTVQAPAAAATAAALAPTVTATQNATVAAVPATATAEAVAPAVDVIPSGDVVVNAPSATATAAVAAPTVDATRFAVVVGVPATATAAVVAPVVEGTANATVAAVAATATAEVLPPVVTGETGEDAFTCLDLDTDAFPFPGTVITAGELVPDTSPRVEAILAAPEMEYGKSYELRVSFDGGAFGDADADSVLTLYAVLGTDPGEVLDYRLLGEFTGPHDATAVFEFGSGVEEYDSAFADGLVNLDLYGPVGSTITAVCWRDVTPPFVEPTPVEDDSEVIDDEVDLTDWLAELTDLPALGTIPATSPLDLDVLRVYESVTAAGTQLVFNGLTEVSRPRPAYRIFAGDTDITSVNGIRTPILDYELIDPGTYGPGTLRVPGLNPLLHDLSAVEWLERGTRVGLQWLDDEGAPLDEAPAYLGRIGQTDETWQVDGNDVVIPLGGLFAGEASMRDRKPTPNRRRRDITYWCVAAGRRLGIPVEGEDTGTTVTSWGNVDFWDYVTKMLSLSQRHNGRRWTMHYDHATTKFVVAEKDRTTIHGTLYFDDGPMKPVGRAEHGPDEVWIDDATDPDGFKTERIAFPALTELTRDWPGEITPDDYAGNEAAVRDMIFLLVYFGFLKRAEAEEDGEAGNFDDAVVDAFADFQAESGFDVQDGTVTEESWDALFSNGDDKIFTTNESRRIPDAERRAVRRYNRGADGQRRETNTHFSPSAARMVVSQSFSLGHGLTSKQVRKWARGQLGDGNARWTLDLDATFGAVIGPHTPGDAVTADDILPPYKWRPGMNFAAPLYQGGQTLHLSGLSISNEARSVKATLDTEFRDSRQAWEIVESHRENRKNPNKAWMQARSSVIPKDKVFGTIREFGILTKPVELLKDAWSTFGLPVGESGTIERFRVMIDPLEGSDDLPEMVIYLSGKKPNQTALAPRPFADDADNQWKVRRGNLRQYRPLVIYGDADAPAGYWPHTKGDEDPDDPGEKVQTTGRFEDDGGIDFYIPGGVLYVTVYARGKGGILQPSRVVWIVPPDN